MTSHCNDNHERERGGGGETDRQTDRETERQRLAPPELIVPKRIGSSGRVFIDS